MTREEAWYVCLRNLSSNENNLFDKNDGKFLLLKPSIKYWYADPIICEINGENWIFVECYDKWLKKGMIGVVGVNEVGKKRPQIIINEPFHMSFPEVFAFRGEWYMIPETHVVSEFRIYKMKKNVFKWELFCAIRTEHCFSDTVVYVRDEKIYLITTEKANDNPYINKLSFFCLEIDCDKNEAKIRELPIQMQNEYGYDVRNGGSILQNEGSLFRVIQKSEYGEYGKAVLLKQITEMGEEGYLESATKIEAGVGKIDIGLNPLFHVMEGIHTYGVCNDFEVLDVKTASISFSSIYHCLQNFCRSRVKKTK